MRSPPGFTLIETIIALVLSSVVLILVSTTFLVQNQYYARQVQLAAGHDNARVATELVARELRSVMQGGIVTAGSRTLTVRSPIVVGVSCGIDVFSNLTLVHFDGGVASLDTAEVAGLGYQRAALPWVYGTALWSQVRSAVTSAPGTCAANGADTTGVASAFVPLANTASILGTVPAIPDQVMLFRQTTFTIAPSVMDSASLGLFRTVYGGSPLEFVTGLGAAAQFQYRTGGSTYADTVTAGSLGAIDAVRIVAEAERRSESGGVEDVDFGWAVNVFLRNVP